MINHYISVFCNAPQFFIFSISGIFFSAPGQTFLISLAIPAICQSLQISAMEFASVYSIATVMASFFLPIIGKAIDRWPLKRTLLLNASLFFLSIMTFSLQTNLVLLFIALFFMRLFGQGALTLTATSITIKKFRTNRGSALSLTQLGYPLSEFIYPSLLVFGLSLLGWRFTFITLALFIPLLYLPLSWYGSMDYKKTNENQVDQSSKSLKFVLRDPFFPIYVAFSSIPPIMMTAALYFQMTIFSNNGWPITNTAIAIFCYALLKFLFTLISGPFVDRYGVLLALFFLTFCIGLATVIIAFQGDPMMGFIYYGLYGAGIGASASTMNYLWGLLYGSDYIGEIKGTIAIIRNGATAVAPVTFSFFLYYLHVPFNAIFFYCGVAIIIMSFLPFIVQYFDQRLQLASKTD